MTSAHHNFLEHKVNPSHHRFGPKTQNSSFTIRKAGNPSEDVALKNNLDNSPFIKIVGL